MNVGGLFTSNNERTPEEPAANATIEVSWNCTAFTNGPSAWVWLFMSTRTLISILSLGSDLIVFGAKWLLCWN